MTVSENLAVIPYLLGIIGFLGVYVLNNINGQLRDVKTSLQSLDTDLRRLLADLDKRVTVIEARCENVHGKE